VILINYLFLKNIYVCLTRLPDPKKKLIGVVFGGTLIFSSSTDPAAILAGLFIYEMAGKLVASRFPSKYPSGAITAHSRVQSKVGGQAPEASGVRPLHAGEALTRGHPPARAVGD